MSLFILLPVLDPRLLSPHPDHLLPYLSKLQTVLFPLLWHLNKQSNKLILRRVYLVRRLRFLVTFLDGLLC